MKKVILYIHGKGGHASEFEQFWEDCPDLDIIGVDYHGDHPWIVEKDIKAKYDELIKQYEQIDILANSIGAYYAMHTLQNCQIGRAFFISPILDMEQLIKDMMQWANVTEKELYEKKEIKTDFGETLSSQYLSFVRTHSIEWHTVTYILYASKDHLTSYETVNDFVNKHDAFLTVMENGEHWFHTEEQLSFLNSWLKKFLKSI